MEKRRQYTASAYTIDFSNHSILLITNDHTVHGH